MNTKIHPKTQDALVELFKYGKGANFFIKCLSTETY